MQMLQSPLALARTAVGLSALAFVVALVGVTPAEAVRAVKRALNADAVDGISASRTPRAGQLLPLGADQRFPASVLPANGRGPRGPQGPPGGPGVQGPPGLAVVRVATRAAAQVPKQANVPIDVARIDNLAPGSWLLMFTAPASDLDGGVVTTVNCDFVVAGAIQPGGGGGVGGTGSATHALVLAGTVATTQTAPFEVVLRCSQNHDLTASTFNLNLGPARLVALRADSLQTSSG